MRTYVWIALAVVFGGLVLWGWRYQYRRAWPTFKKDESVAQMEEAAQLIRGRRCRITPVVLSLCRGKETDRHDGRAELLPASLNRASSSEGKPEPSNSYH
jgi:hypothetical protein